MSFTYNGTEVQGVTYNGAEVKSITYNGVEVWSAIAIPSDLSKATPEQVQYAAQHDLAASLWDIGDYFEMTLDGSWTCDGNNVIKLNNYVIRCVLIGINHNAEVEGNHLLHFQMGKNTDNVDVAFSQGRIYINGSSGGWRYSDMRLTAMVNLYNKIPSNWRAVIKPCTKYTDNTGDGSDTASYVTATSDNCFLLAEYEIFGIRKFANSAEQNYQKQYAYYANGNSKVRYKHNSPASNASWLERSPFSYNGYAECFCFVSSSGDANWGSLNSYSGISPVFCIG